VWGKEAPHYAALPGNLGKGHLDKGGGGNTGAFHALTSSSIPVDMCQQRLMGSSCIRAAGSIER
jgi:hypothetical protein